MVFFLLNVTPNTNGNWLRKIWRRKCIFKHFSVSVSNKFWETNQPTNQSFIFQRQNTSVKIYYDSYLNLYCVIKKSKAYHKASFPLRYWSTHLSAASSEVTSFHRWQYYNIMLGCETCPLHIILKNKPLYHQPHLFFFFQQPGQEKSYLPTYSGKKRFWCCNIYRRCIKIQMC